MFLFCLGYRFFLVSLQLVTCFSERGMTMIFFLGGSECV